MSIGSHSAAETAVSAQASGSTAIGKPPPRKRRVIAKTDATELPEAR